MVLTHSIPDERELITLGRAHSDADGRDFKSSGMIIILLLYIILLFRIVIISYKSNNIFGQLLSLAVGLPIVFQALINMGVAVHLFPVTGQPLPLISTGGTSIWITFFAFGILLSISRTNFLNNIELETEKINNES